jgi:hypothetical protein
MSGDGKMLSKLYLHAEEPDRLKDHIVNTIYASDLIEDCQPIIICDTLSCYLAQNHDEEAADLTLYTYDKKVKIQVLIENCLIISKLNQAKNKLKEAHMHGWLVNLILPAIDIKISYFESVGAFSVQFVLTCEDYTKNYLGKSEVWRKIEETQDNFNFVENEWREEIVSLLQRFKIIQIAIDKIKKNDYFGWNNLEEFFENNDYLIIKDMNHEIEKRSRTVFYDYQLKLPQILLNRDSSKHPDYDSFKGVEKKENFFNINSSSIFQNKYTPNIISSFSFCFAACREQDSAIKQEIPNIIKSVNLIKIENDLGSTENNQHNNQESIRKFGEVYEVEQHVKEYRISNQILSEKRYDGESNENYYENISKETQKNNFSTNPVNLVKKETISDTNYLKNNSSNHKNYILKVSEAHISEKVEKNQRQFGTEIKDKDFENVINDWVFTSSKTENKQKNPYIPYSDSDENYPMELINNIIIPNTEGPSNIDIVKAQHIDNNIKNTHNEEEANFSFGENCEPINIMNNSQFSKSHNNSELFSYKEAHSYFGSATKNHPNFNKNNLSQNNKRFSNNDTFSSPHEINKLNLGKDLTRFCEENSDKLKNLTQDDLRLFIIFSKRIKAEIESCDKLSSLKNK